MALSIVLGIIFISVLLSLLVKKRSNLLARIAIAASIIELILTLFIFNMVLKNGPYSLNNYLSVDYFGIIVMLTVAVVNLAATWYSGSYLKFEMERGFIGFSRVKQFFVLLHLFILAMFFAIATTNPILMWISIEATTLSTAFLVSFSGKPSAIEAAWKYLIINSVGLLIGFLGTLLFFHPAAGDLHRGLLTWGWMTDNVLKFDPSIIKFAFIFVLVGYGTKVGLVPMHTWRPDAYSKAPIPIVALLSGALLNVAFLAILRFKVVADSVVGSAYSQKLLIFFGLASILVTAFIIFTQKNYKRLLAYSSIEHAGIIALGFGFGGFGAFAAILHMLYHSLAKSILFLSSGNIFLKYGSTKIKNVAGVLKTLPVTGILFFIGFLAITGMPPFGIFFTEFSIMAVGIVSHPIVVAIVIIALALIFVGFLKQVTAMMFGEAKKETAPGEADKNILIPIILLAIILLVLGFYLPDSIKSIITLASSAY